MQPRFSQKLSGAFLAALGLSLLFSCHSSDHSLEVLRDLLTRPGMARIVVLYPAPVMGSNGMAQVKFTEHQSCDLNSGGYVVEDIKPGKENLAFSFCGMPGASHLALNAVEGGKYYVRILPYDSSFRGIVSGYANENISPGAPLHEGPFKIEVLDETEAFSELGGLKLSNNL